MTGPAELLPPAEGSPSARPGAGMPLLTSDGGLVVRRAARALLIDGADRVLLLRGRDPARPDHRYWFTVGGGLDPGEKPVEGALREVYEETGLILAPSQLVGPFWRETTRFSFDGQRYEQDQEFFAARVTAFTVDRSGQNAIERATVDAARWWSAGSLETTDELFYPDGLPTLLRTATGLV